MASRERTSDGVVIPRVRRTPQSPAVWAADTDQYAERGERPLPRDPRKIADRLPGASEATPALGSVRLRVHPVAVPSGASRPYTCRPRGLAWWLRYASMPGSGSSFLTGRGDSGSVLRAPCSVLRAPCSVLRAPCSVPCAVPCAPYTWSTTRGIALLLRWLSRWWSPANQQIAATATPDRPVLPTVVLGGGFRRRLPRRLSAAASGGGSRRRSRRRLSAAAFGDGFRRWSLLAPCLVLCLLFSSPPALLFLGSLAPSPPPPPLPPTAFRRLARFLPPALVEWFVDMSSSCVTRPCRWGRVLSGPDAGSGEHPGLGGPVVRSGHRSRDSPRCGVRFDSSC
ncbi:hypothetical protein CLV69_104604 [Amycolatopsis arida]|nr:hypothetical protein CLV69_104604 [Amycolatopsis arida]